MNRDIKELINKRTILGSKIASGLLACALLASCGTQPPKNETGDNSKIEEAKKIAIEKIGGYGSSQGEDLLSEAAAYNEKKSEKNFKKNKNGTEKDIAYYQLDRKVGADKQQLLTAIMTQETGLKATKAAKKAGKARPETKLKDGITGYYGDFAKEIMKADGDNEKAKTQHQRHSHLFILAKGLDFVKDMKEMLGEEESSITARITSFEQEIAEAEAGIHGIIKKDKPDTVIFNQHSEDTYKLPEASKTAAEKLIKDVQEAREAYRKVYVEETK